jgi:hypothetical protein
MPLDPGDAKTVVRCADHARDVDRDLNPSDLGEGVVGSRVVVEGDRALVGDEVVGREPVLPDDDGVRRDGADILDETREVPSDLRIGRPVVGDRGGDGLRLSELVDLDHPGRHGAACRLPEEAAGKTCGEEQIAEREQAPVAGLDARGADALVPDLRRLLKGRLGPGGAAIADRCAAKHQRSSLRLTDVEPPP